jgi:hypothetical protein
MSTLVTARARPTEEGVHSDAIAVCDLSKRYGNGNAVDGISFTVA